MQRVDDRTPERTCGLDSWCTCSGGVRKQEKETELCDIDPEISRVDRVGQNVAHATRTTKTGPETQRGTQTT
jgi:hypothetical protein